MTGRMKFRRLAVIGALLVALLSSASMMASAAPQPGRALALDSGTQFYVPKPLHGALEQIAQLTSSGEKQDAALIKAMVQTPQAVWFNGGSPKEVKQAVRSTVLRAADKGQIPVLVAYNLPFRDCSQYSAGGAASLDDYLAWIDGLAAGIGSEPAVVILEPDGLGIIPWNHSLDGGLEWCQPAEADPATAASDRYEALNGAVDALKASPNTKVYLDATHSSWLGVGDIARRLVAGGVERADGFFLNVSNYQYTANQIQYGKWISECIAYTQISPGDYGACPNQYWNGGPLPAKIAQLIGEWTGVALSPYGEWNDGTDMPNLNTSGINLRYSNMLGAVQPTVHFVIDTSRNGRGPWNPPSHPAGDAQDWCNPPDRGLGIQPTADTGVALLDAYLWIKIPGASDGQCYRWTSGPQDPVRGVLDPPAGEWFGDMALELVHFADPEFP